LRFVEVPRPRQRGRGNEIEFVRSRWQDHWRFEKSRHSLTAEPKARFKRSKPISIGTLLAAWLDDHREIGL